MPLDSIGHLDGPLPVGTTFGAVLMELQLVQKTEVEARAANHSVGAFVNMLLGFGCKLVGEHWLGTGIHFLGEGVRWQKLRVKLQKVSALCGTDSANQL